MKNRKLLVTAIGVVVGLLAAAFVVRTLFVEWDATRDALADASWPWLVVAIGLAAVSMLAIAWVWLDVIEALENNKPTTMSPRRVPFLARYFVGELGKYLPGGIWTVIGRAELATRAGVGRAVAYSSVALSLITLYLAGAGVAAALLPFGLFQSGGGEADGRAVMGLLVVVLGGFAVLHPKTLGLLVRNVERIVKRRLRLVIPAGRTTAVLVLRYVPAWLAVAAASYAVARALTNDVSFTEVALATVASWIAGFIAVPVPAGGGVREAVFLALCGLPAGLGAAVALISRLIFVLVDAVGAGLGSIVLRRTTTASPLATEQS